jgi:hypothetical protein
METKINKHVAPPRYDEAFKEGAVHMVTEQQKTIREVASDLGICIDTLRHWWKSYALHWKFLGAVITLGNLESPASDNKPIRFCCAEWYYFMKNIRHWGWTVSFIFCAQNSVAREPVYTV